MQSHEEIKAKLARCSAELHEIYPRDLRERGELFAGSHVYQASDCLNSAVEELGGKVIIGELAPTNTLEE